MPRLGREISYKRLEQINQAPPNSDEFEISLFGPGVGECLVLHLGESHWMVVDSCSDKNTREPIAANYLRSLGLDPQTSIRQIVITHWHDDHIRGLSSLVRDCPQALIYHPAAHQPDEYIRLTEVLSPSGMSVDRETSGVKELGLILRELGKRAKSDRTYVQDKFRQVGVDRVLFDKLVHGEYVAVKALSPCDVELTNALTEIAALVPKALEQRCVLPEPDRNNTAVALWVKFGAVTALLGSDLEETDDPNTGWSVVVRDQRLSPKASIFKIPHHGSDTADSDAVWENLVADSPTSIATAYSRSDLPRAVDVARICGRSGVFACTTVPKSVLPRRDPAVERTLREVAKSRKPVRGEMGHIQIRIPINGQPILRGNAFSAQLTYTTGDGRD